MLKTTPYLRLVVFSAVLLLSMTLGCNSSGSSGPPIDGNLPPSERGWRFLMTHAYGDIAPFPPVFGLEVLDSFWKVWPEPLRTQAKNATPEERRKMIYSRYGLLEAPDVPGRPKGVPLSFNLVDEKLYTNCFFCHAGKVAGKVYPGLNNSHLALQTFAEDGMKIGGKIGQWFAAFLARFSKDYKYSSVLPAPVYSTTNGTNNAFYLAAQWGAFRDLHLNQYTEKQRGFPLIDNFSTQTPAWFTTKKKQMLYWTAFIEKTPRDLMQFVMSPNNDSEAIQGWGDNFKDVLAWIEALEPPKYPFAIDDALALRGLVTFTTTCAKCHGTYGEGSTYPDKVIDIHDLKTDPVRLYGMGSVFIAFLRDSWLGLDGTGPGGRARAILTPKGYIAPPLDGIWSRAPYFHNGSVPTLWHVINHDQRPQVWLRTEDGYDQEKVGLEMTAFESLPASATEGWQQRQYFQTSLPGKKATGHKYAEGLSKAEIKALLEYLKTL